MLKKTLTYKNFNDVEVTKTFLFNLTEAEIMEMQLSTEGGLDVLIQKIVDAKDAPSIIKVFKDIILKAYGELDADGEVFMKSKEISAKFACTQAYSILFTELATDPDKAAEFIKGIIPQNTNIQAVAK